MQLGEQAQAVLLLTVPLGKEAGDGAKPLTNGEWARFAVWLRDHELQPASLMTSDIASALSGLIDRSISAERVQRLLDRGGALGLSLERWERAGLWVLTRADDDYPERLKRRLRADAPPVLFGCGNRTLLNTGGVAVVGSRDAAEDDLAFAASIGRDAAGQGHSVVSGGARGVDQSAMLGALENEGTAVGVLADSLLRAATSSGYRPHLMSRNLVLLSNFNPEAGFNVGNAMARNRYIYCLADVAIVVSCAHNQGGTWNGAVENLKAGWVPLWVKPTKHVASGAPHLVRQGARWLPEGALDLVGMANAASDASAAGPADDAALPLAPDAATPPALRELAAVLPTEPPAEAAAEKQPASLYDVFLKRLRVLTLDKPLSAAAIADELALTKAQVTAWLKRALSEDAIRKSGRPTAYQSVENRPGQTSLFAED
jgi:predicted Rossmann fold nucleotide-binding protein DprA/Smf involved in DNA uptake